ncbi:hypothetical protein T08_12650 [Trichinella sp. T8]|nr:hypothetical protein T08_12650 [Trichinella sp. T8]
MLDVKDFMVTYCSVTRCWTAAWKWSDGAKPGTLRNVTAEYPSKNEIRASYEQELEEWIKDGWLVPYVRTNADQSRGYFSSLWSSATRRKPGRHKLQAEYPH